MCVCDKKDFLNAKHDVLTILVDVHVCNLVCVFQRFSTALGLWFWHELVSLFSFKRFVFPLLTYFWLTYCIVSWLVSYSLTIFVVFTCTLPYLCQILTSTMYNISQIVTLTRWWMQFYFCRSRVEMSNFISEYLFSLL